MIFFPRMVSDYRETRVDQRPARSIRETLVFGDPNSKVPISWRCILETAIKTWRGINDLQREPIFVSKKWNYSVRVWKREFKTRQGNI